MATAFGQNKGGLHRATHTPQGQPIPPKKVESAAHSGNSHVHHMAQAAINANPGKYHEDGVAPIQPQRPQRPYPPMKAQAAEPPMKPILPRKMYGR